MANISDIEKREKELKMDIEDLKQKLDLEKKELINTYETKLDKLHDELLLRMKVEIHEIEERKNQHINELMKQHEIAFQEMKIYYNDITKLNLEMIDIQKNKLQEIKQNIEQYEKAVIDLRQAALEMKGPLAEAEAIVGRLKKDVQTFDKDVMALRNAKGFRKDLK